MAKGLAAWVDRAFWALLLGVCSYGVGQLRDLADSVAKLNSQVAVILARQTDQDRRIDSHDDRLKYLEREDR